MQPQMFTLAMVFQVVNIQVWALIVSNTRGYLLSHLLLTGVGGQSMRK